MYKPVFCICQDIGQTAAIVNNLKMAGFSNNEISLVFPDNTTLPGLQQNSDENADSAEEDSLDLEWLSGIDSLDIPGVGRFIAAGPIMVELSRTPQKDQADDLIGALVGVGIPAHHAEHYQEKIKAGRTLIAVNTATVETRDTANTIFQQAEAEDISSSEEVSVIV
ncbi:MULTISPECIES: general stress protein [Methylomonas]|uniref:Uncharacterized protein n=2 Tax=Methylomonas TaxID=416 RepID=A0A126T921_9GAMM|nr:MULTISPECIES: general stress protein [Methylomonas]AMK78560.1 hypothetical protein JT25_019035 [Methylomonas denitrificans]OAI06470.1 hypothetical protein A1342_06555 [Methylomonas methanica]TCV77394.1 heat induced stress protein YflT [Methylomonas methanica]